MGKKILIIGAYGGPNNKLDGQTIKTRNIHSLLKNNTNATIYGFDTMLAKKNPLLVFSLFFRLLVSDVVIIVPCLKNLTFIFPVIYYLSKICKYDIIHICIGGWQVEYFKGNGRFSPHSLQMKLSRKIKAFLPEMKKVNDELKSIFCFTNTEVLPNFRPVEKSLVNTHAESLLKLVYLARINKKKGYSTIFKLAEYIKENKLQISITFYGQIDAPDKNEFMANVEKYKDVVNYSGVLVPEKITGTLVNYDVMIFPTQYYTEGIPGTIIDAYIAGLPVIATNWKHATEVVKDGVTGYIVPFDDTQEIFNDRILKLYNDRGILQCMKENSKAESYRYSYENAWSILKKYV